MIAELDSTCALGLHLGIWSRPILYCFVRICATVKQDCRQMTVPFVEINSKYVLGPHARIGALTKVSVVIDHNLWVKVLRTHESREFVQCSCYGLSVAWDYTRPT